MKVITNEAWVTAEAQGVLVPAQPAADQKAAVMTELAKLLTDKGVVTKGDLVVALRQRFGPLLQREQPKEAADQFDPTLDFVLLQQSKCETKKP
jgi:hypothetical protein